MANKEVAGKRRILIAEDEKPLARALELKLGDGDYDVRVALNGEEAVAELGKQKFDIVLLDLMMPKMDGFEVLESMKKRGDKTPVIVLTNLSQPEDEKRVMDLGAKEFFVKSNTSIANIVARVKRLLGEI
jgi:two-component system copper resistance phosphate regulon response regulator CusR